MSNSSLLLRNEVRAEQSKSSNSQQVQGRNESSTDDNPGTSRSSLMERFSTVYESLTAQIPCDDIEDDLYETDCVPALDRIPVAEGVPLSSGVLTRAPAGPHVTVTNCDGRRVYLKVRSSEVSDVFVLVYTALFYLHWTCTCSYTSTHAYKAQ